MNLLALDTRWRRFNDENWACPCCGQSFSGVFDIGYDHPDSWPHGSLRESGAQELQVGADKLSSDLCRWDEHRFIKCVMPLPIKGSEEIFQFGAWGSVAEENFYRYIDDAVGEGAGFDGCFSWMMNDLPLFGADDPIKCTLIPGPEGERPRLMAQDGPLAHAQAEGISFDQLLDIYAATGTDIRPHLMG